MKIKFPSELVDSVVSGKIDLQAARDIITKELDKQISKAAPKEKPGLEFCCWSHGWMKYGNPRMRVDGHIYRSRLDRKQEQDSNTPREWWEWFR